MLITIEPKQAFQKNNDHTKSFHETVDNPVFMEGLHLAISEFVLKYQPTTEELQGVRRFLDTLVNFGEKPEADRSEEQRQIMRSIATARPTPQPKK